MNVAVTLEFKADRKEPLGDLIRRVAAAFDQADLEPQVSATFSDGPPGIRTTSAVERAIKKYPHLARFERSDAPLQRVGLPNIRRLTNVDGEEAFPMADLLALADGLPRSLPFQSVNVLFGHADFGKAHDFPIGLTPPTGISIGDNWWINGRNRALSAFYAVDADATARTLPEPLATIGAILSSLGKPKRSAQFVAPRLASPAPAATTKSATPALPLDVAAISPIVAKYRAGMMALVERIGLPHDLPAPNDVRQMHRGASGPLKPTLVDAFKPRGYSCRGGSGTFTLRRRTAANHVVDIELDVGTWSRSLTAMFSVHGPGFNATLTMPVTLRGGGQYPIGDTANWERIVANLATIADELERTFVAEIEGAVGPAPAWFEPGR
jgi:hypothetical protein